MIRGETVSPFRGTVGIDIATRLGPALGWRQAS